MNVTKLTYSDNNVRQMANIERQCFKSEAWTEDMLTQAFTNNNVEMWCVEHDGSIVADILLGLFDSAEIISIAVLPEYRRQGIAEALLSTAIDYARKCNCRQVLLEVNVENVNAIALYEKLGFEKLCVRHNFYEQTMFNSRDAYTMRLSLT